MKKEIYPTSIRLEKETYDKIKEDAQRDGRSITKQIEQMLKKYYDIKKELK